MQGRTIKKTLKHSAFDNSREQGTKGHFFMKKYSGIGSNEDNITKAGVGVYNDILYKIPEYSVSFKNFTQETTDKQERVYITTFTCTC